MAVRPGLSLTPSQRQQLAMTPRMRQSVELLRMSSLETADFVAAQIEGNPFLSKGRGTAGGSRGAGEAAGPAADWQDSIAAAPTLYAQLTQDIRLACADPAERAIAFHLMTLLDERGYLMSDWQDTASLLGCREEQVEAVLRRLQGLEPAGIFARDLRECLRIQWLEREDWSPAAGRLLDNLALLAKRDIAALQQRCGLTAAELQRLVKTLRSLEPKPLSRYETPPVLTLPPDLVVEKTPQGWRVRVNGAVLPRVLLDRDYYRDIRASTARREDKDYLSDRLRHARWLIRALDQRIQTLLRVGEAVFARQAAFLTEGSEALRPLTLKELARTLALHESTVSRAVAHKTVETPRGLYDLRAFFSTGLPGHNKAVSAAAVRARLARWIAEESPDAVLSDDTLAARLGEEGVLIARRTVAKYREMLRLPGSAQRRREKRNGRGQAERK